LRKILGPDLEDLDKFVVVFIDDILVYSRMRKNMKGIFA
jgi:hypothetical protein